MADNNPIYSAAVIDMVRVAAEYCLMLERLSQERPEKDDLLLRLTRVLPLIYVKASLLPKLEEQGLGDLADSVSESDYEEVRQAVWNILREDDEYLEVFTPDMQYSDGPLMITISEDLADIYQDLKNFVAQFAQQNEVTMNDAVVRLAENFRTYWGQRLVNAMRPLHELTYKNSQA